MRILYRIDTSEYATHKIVNISVLNFIANFKSLKKYRHTLMREIQFFYSRHKRNFSRISVAGSFFLALIIANETESAGFRMPMSGVHDRKSEQRHGIRRAIELQLAYVILHHALGQIVGLKKIVLIILVIFDPISLSSFDIRYHRM